MAKVFVKHDGTLSELAGYVEQYIRQLTVHNLSVHEKNADLCINLVSNISGAEKMIACKADNPGKLEGDFSTSLSKQIKDSKGQFKGYSKNIVSKEEYLKNNSCPTVTVVMPKSGVDIEKYGTMISQSIVLTFNPNEKFDVVSGPDKKDKPVKRSADKSYLDRKFVQEPTSNAKLLFKKS